MRDTLTQPTLRQRLLSVTRGRPLALLLLLLILVVEGLYVQPNAFKERYYPNALNTAIEAIRSPVYSVQLWSFDLYQKLFPREPKSAPVTILAIDEKSLAKLGQWPWPRDILANIINSVDIFAPAALGLDIYMPEPDQNSIQTLAARLAPDQQYLIEELKAVPSSDFLLTMALSSTPSVISAAGFDFDAYTTSDELFIAPINSVGEDPIPHVFSYPRVLASLPDFQVAAAGQALVSVPSTSGAIRRIPLVSAINGTLVPSLTMEMLRVATGEEAISINASKSGVDTVSVAGLDIHTLQNGEIWLHYAPLEQTRFRYLSIADLLEGNFDPTLLESKLVLIGMTGGGLYDVRFTALGEAVPGIEIQAQALEAIFDDALLTRPGWLALLETGSILGAGLLLIWHIPRRESRLGALLKHRPLSILIGTAVISALLMALGVLLFQRFGVLFAASNIIFGLALVMGVFFVNALLENLKAAEHKLERLVETGISAGRVKLRKPLLDMALEGMNDLAPHQASFVVIKNDAGLLETHAQAGFEQTFDPVRVDQAAQPLTETLSKAQIQIYDQTQQEADWSQIETASDLRIHTALVAPLIFSDGSVSGLIVLLNAQDPMTGQPDTFAPESIKFVETLTAQIAVALENQDLVTAQKNMMDAMIKMIAGAIDAKSPYTGGHCERVPELANMLCRAASACDSGPLRDFALTTEDEWKEFEIAAWLHDCGKVTTPEHVVDKATKLETIYNRIHEVRTRFEVLLRDAEIDRLVAIHERGEPAEQANERFTERKAALIDDFTFIAECNEGGEFLSEERIERIRSIGAQRWTRHFDNRIGLSGDEQRRLPDIQETLPVSEALLSDRPEHLIERPPSKALDERFGFKMEVPEHLYNLGEVYNLSISRGTLTAEDRFKINEHIIQTIFILEQMPFPPHLKRVPEIAGAHHETLIGTGYPRKLTAEDLSIPARIMAIADIFEALTASDRPYKKAKTLSESIKILSFFKKDQHIDPVLFDLFLTSGIYRTYAERFLLPDQIDEVDIHQYLG